LAAMHGPAAEALRSGVRQRNGRRGGVFGGGDTDLTRSTRAPHFTPQHWLLCHMGLY